MYIVGLEVAAEIRWPRLGFNSSVGRTMVDLEGFASANIGNMDLRSAGRVATGSRAEKCRICGAIPFLYRVSVSAIPMA
jgi:hypothetical protein